MKQTLVVLILVLLLAGSSEAQIGFGVTGGVNLATVGGADVPSDVKTLTGFAAGAYLEINPPFLLSVQPEILYSVKGYVPVEQSFTVNGATQTVKATVTLHYLEVPILIKYSLPVPIVKPSLFAGPYLGILQSAKMKLDVTGQSTLDTDIKDSTSSTDVGFVVGASAQIAIVRVSARYTFGLTTLDKNGTVKVFNRVWGIMLEIPM